MLNAPARSIFTGTISLSSYLSCASRRLIPLTVLPQKVCISPRHLFRLPCCSAFISSADVSSLAAAVESDATRHTCAQELSLEPAIDGFKVGMELGNQMRAMAEEELVRVLITGQDLGNLLAQSLLRSRGRRL